MIRFCNSDMSHSMETYWVDYDGQLVVRRVLGPGESYLESSWATHPWVIRDRTTDEALLVVVGSDAANMDQFYSAVWNSGACLPAPADALLRAQLSHRLCPCASAADQCRGVSFLVRQGVKHTMQPLAGAANRQMWSSSKGREMNSTRGSSRGRRSKKQSLKGNQSVLLEVCSPPPPRFGSSFA